MPWKRLLGPLQRLPASPLPAWYAQLQEQAQGLSTAQLAILGGRLSATPGLAFLAGYQAALRALWPEAPASLGAFCVTERRSVRPADMTTRFHEGRLSGCKDFVTGGSEADWFLVAARSEPDGAPIRITLCSVARDATGVALENLPPLPIATDIPHARLLLDNATAKALPGDGWDDYAKPFRTLEDIHVLLALSAWLYGVALDCRRPQTLRLKLAGLLAAGSEVARLDPCETTTHLLLGGVFAQFESLQAELNVALESTGEWAELWRRDSELLRIAGSARQKRLEKAEQQVFAHPL
jgi:hypothetical protein